MPSSVSFHNPAHSVPLFISHLLAIMLLTAGMGNSVLAGSAAKNEGGGRI